MPFVPCAPSSSRLVVPRGSRRRRPAPEDAVSVKRRCCVWALPIARAGSGRGRGAALARLDAIRHEASESSRAPRPRRPRLPVHTVLRAARRAPSTRAVPSRCAAQSARIARYAPGGAWSRECRHLPSHRDATNEIHECSTGPPGKRQMVSLGKRCDDLVNHVQNLCDGK